MRILCNTRDFVACVKPVGVDSEHEMPELERKERLLSDVVEGLKARDNRIYEEIFHMSAPDVDRLSSMDFLSGLDSIPDDNIVRYTEGKISGFCPQKTRRIHHEVSTVRR